MLQDPRLAKADLLLRQDRPAEAERCLRELAATAPDDIRVLAMLAGAVESQGRADEAMDLVNRAVGLRPEIGYLHVIRGRLLLRSKRYEAAEEAARAAIACDPSDADAHVLLAQVQLFRKQFTAALAAADAALACDPEHLAALNLRSTALVKLDRREESYATIEGALREDPDNAYTHANYGWGLLETGDYDKAKEHFAQSLRADPTDDYARSGMAEAVKARNPLYRLFLKYAFFMQNLTDRYQWGVIIGIYVLYRIINGVARSNPELQPVLYPLLGVLTVVAISTWVIEPIGNLFLRFDRHARFLLDRDEHRTANLTTACLTAAALGVIGYLVTREPAWLVLAAFGFTMILPVGQVFAEVKNPWLMKAYAIALALVGGAGVFFAFWVAPFNLFTLIYLFALFVFQWVANFQLIRQ